MLATNSKQLTTETFQEALDSIEFNTPEIRQLYTIDGELTQYAQVGKGDKWSAAKVLPKDKEGNFKLWNVNAKDKLNSSALFYEAFSRPEYAGCNTDTAWLGGTFENVELLSEKYNVQGFAISTVWDPIPKYYISFERIVCENQFGSLGTTNSSIYLNLNSLFNKYKDEKPEEVVKHYIQNIIDQRVQLQEMYLDKLRGIKVSEDKIDNMFCQLTVNKVKDKASAAYENKVLLLEKYRKAYNRDDNQNYKGTFLGFINSHTNITSRTRTTPWSVIQPPVSKSVLENPCTFDYLCRDTIVNANKLYA